MKVIDNFLPKEYFLNLKDVIMGNKFPWFYDDYQFTHNFFNDETNILHSLLNQLNVKHLYKLEAIQNPVNKGKQLRRWESVENSLTSILYVNTNDGYTKFEDGTVVESIENRLVSFDSQLKHVGFGCTNYKRKLLININYSVVT